MRTYIYVVALQPVPVSLARRIVRKANAFPLGPSSVKQMLMAALDEDRPSFAHTTIQAENAEEAYDVGHESGLFCRERARMEAITKRKHFLLNDYVIEV
jgi:hypothetical protein